MQALSQKLDLELPAAPESVAEARHAAARMAREHGVGELDVKIAVSEAVGNAVVHAYRETEPGTIRVHGRVAGDKLVFEVSDRGVGMSPHPGARGLSLGIPLIAKVAHDLRIEGGSGGTTVRFSFPLGATA